MTLYLRTYCGNDKDGRLYDFYSFDAGFNLNQDKSKHSLKRSISPTKKFTCPCREVVNRMH